MYGATEVRAQKLRFCEASSRRVAADSTLVAALAPRRGAAQGPRVTRRPVTLQKIKRDIMNLQIFFQLAAILFIVGAGPLVVVLLASRGGNL